MWNLFEGKHMFALLPQDKDINACHLAQMVALLGGPPPLEFLRRSKTKIPWQYFTERGEWRGPADIPEDTLETTEENLRGDDKAQFLAFVRKMVRWKPEDRRSARELLEDPWLQEPK